jgi:hypothetical protein
VKRLDMIKRVRSNTRDLSNSIFREDDIVMYLNEAIDRFKQVFSQLKGMTYLQDNDAVPALIPEHMHILVPLYATSRCFAQDERHYQATNYMNEFETKLEEFRMKVELGEEVLTDADGNDLGQSYVEDYVVKSNYYFESEESDDDEGVEGVTF